MSYLIQSVLRLWMLILKTLPFLPTAAECLYVCCCVLSVWAASHLFVQTGLDMKRFIRHDKVPGGFDRGHGSLAFWSVLDLPEHQLHHAPVGRNGGNSTNYKIKTWNVKRLIFFHSSTVLRLFKGQCSGQGTLHTETHRLRILASWLSALNALISNSTAHCCRRREKRCHHPVTCSRHHFDSSVTFLPCRHHGPLAEGPLSKAGCQGTVTTTQHVSQWISLSYRQLYWVILSFTQKQLNYEILWTSCCSCHLNGIWNKVIKLLMVQLFFIASCT